MNPLQYAELEILQAFVAACEKLGLKYYLVCGTALGAVKYSGFIPWDDDVDVALPREDYERFLLEAPALLPQQIFVQNYKTDPYFPHIYTKLRNCNTTFIEEGTAHLAMNHGVYIDVFPLDGYPKGKISGKVFELRKKLFTWKQYCALKGDKNLKVRLRNQFFRLLGYHKRTAKTLAKLDSFYKRYPAEASAVWCNHGNWQRSLEYAARTQYGAGTGGVFEGLQVRIPEQYDAYLTQKYGDWRADLPEEKQVSHHLWIVCDVDKPYTYYANQNKNISMKNNRHCLTKTYNS